MHAPKKRVLLKLTGAILTDPATGHPSSSLAMHIIDQIKKLSGTHQCGIVIGGGNFFRGKTQGKQLELTSWTGHNIGMLATVMNALILKDLMTQQGINSTILSAIHCPDMAHSISQDEVAQALITQSCIIFAGGTGMPYFTTDTNSVIRSLQMGASELWKCTNVDGIYDSDPAKNPKAQLLPTLTFKQAIDNHLEIMDMTAFTLAQEHKLHIRILNIFKSDSLIHASQDPHFGSLIHP